MAKRRTDQEWQMLIEQSESSSLSKLAFCKLNGLNPSTFYAKRQRLNETIISQGFVKAEVVEKTTKYQATANMTCCVTASLQNREFIELEDLQMKLGHILYKVNDLDEAVEEFSKRGFTVEYGKKNNAYNALIYFAEGPYLELFHNSGMPSLVKTFLKLIGKKPLVHRLNTWENSKEGLIGVALENDRFDLDIEQRILDRANQKYFKVNSGRTDAKGRKLRFKVIMPDEMAIPFLVTEFNINVRPPKDYVHPNGVKRIKSVSFGTKEEFVPIIKQLCDDGLELFIGDDVKNLEFEYVE